MIKVGLILVAGKNQRFKDYWYSKFLPKSLFTILDKPILDYVLYNAFDFGLEKIYMIVNHKKNAIVDYIKNKDLQLDIEFIEQKRLDGIANAILLTENYINEPFFTFLGDCFNVIKAHNNLFNLYNRYKPIAIQGVVKSSISELIQSNEVHIKGNRITNIKEKPKYPKSKYMGTGIYLFRENIYDFIKVTDKNKITGFREISDTINLLAKHKQAYAWRISGTSFNINKINTLEKARNYAMTHNITQTFNHK